MSAASANAWARAHPAAKAENNRRYRLKIRRETITAYGGKCAKCSNSNYDDLELDHVEGQGNKQREEIFGYGHNSPGGWNFYLWLKKHGFPQDLGLQLLCTDCHDEKDRACPGHWGRRA
jgi:hypothetical protein